jgi:hypothetical protein
MQRITSAPLCYKFLQGAMCKVSLPLPRLRPPPHAPCSAASRYVEHRLDDTTRSYGTGHAHSALRSAQQCELVTKAHTCFLYTLNHRRASCLSAAASNGSVFLRCSAFRTCTRGTTLSRCIALPSIRSLAWHHLPHFAYTATGVVAAYLISAGGESTTVPSPSVRQSLKYS